MKYFIIHGNIIYDDPVKMRSQCSKSINKKRVEKRERNKGRELILIKPEFSRSGEYGWLK